jgi:hypothetical protein
MPALPPAEADGRGVAEVCTGGVTGRDGGAVWTTGAFACGSVAAGVELGVELGPELGDATAAFPGAALLTGSLT